MLKFFIGLFLFIGPVQAQLTFYAAPRNGAVVPRSVVTNYADVRFAGIISGSTYTKLRIKCWQNGSVQSDQITSLSYSSGSAVFDKTIKIKAGKYRYRFLIEAIGKDTLRAQFIDILAGDIYIIQGQSNAVANVYGGLSNTNYRDSFIRSFGTSSYDPAASSADTFWYVANGDGFYNKGCVGQWGLVMAKMLLDSFGIPIALINGAVGGTSVAYHQRNNTTPDNINTCYGRLLTRMRKADLDKKVRGIFWFQGESDGTNPVLHDTLFRRLYADWTKDFKGMQFNYMVQVRGGGCGNPTAAMLEIQRQFEFDLPKLRMVSANGLNGHDGCHYKFLNGYQLLGQQFAAMVSKDLYNGSKKSHVDPPSISTVYYSNAAKSEITLEMRNPLDSVFVDFGFQSLFSISGDNTVNIIGGFLRNNKVILQLNKGTCFKLKLSYMGKSGVQPWVKNKIGCGLIGFDKVPIETPKMRTGYTGCPNTKIVMGEDSIAGCKYNWLRKSDNKTKTTAKISELIIKDDYYRIVVYYTSTGCLTDTFNISLVTDKTPYPNVGNDTILCNGNSAEFKLPELYQKIIWKQNKTTATGLSYSTISSGKVMVQTTSFLGCQGADSLVISTASPVIKLPQDLMVCKGKDTLISMDNTFLHYLWNNEIMGGNRYRQGIGTLTLEVTDSFGCMASDSSQIKEYEVTIFHDISLGICPYDSINISKPAEAKYWFLNGTELPALFKSGLTHVNIEYIDSNSCTSTGSILVSAKPLPVFSLGKDTAICPGNNTTIKCEYFAQNYLWNGELKPSAIYLVSAPGIVICKVTNTAGCVFSDTIKINLNPLPNFYWPSDTLICTGVQWEFNLPVGNNYLLNGEFIKNNRISQPGYYTIHAKNKWGCSTQKLAVVSFKDCVNSSREFNKSIFKIYPNPAINSLNLSFIQGEIRICNAAGQVVLHKTHFSSDSLDISELPPGVYTLLSQSGLARFVKL